MCACLYGIFGVAFHQSEFLEAVGHESAYVEMHVHPLDARTCFLDDEVVTSFDDAVDIALFLCETTADWGYACVVGTIVVDGFCAGIAKEESACFEWT